MLLRLVTSIYEFLQFLAKVYKHPATLYHHSTTDIKKDDYERNTADCMQLYQQFVQLLLQLAQREEEEAQQLANILRVIYGFFEQFMGG